MTPGQFEHLRQTLRNERLSRVCGTVAGVSGLVVQAVVPDAFMGEIAKVHARNGAGIVPAEVVGFRQGQALLMPLGPDRNIGVDCEVEMTGDTLRVPVGEGLLGRVLDGLGRPMDGASIRAESYRSVWKESPHPLHRKRIEEQLPLGIKAIDAILPCGKGQRVGIFAAAGGGKSTLMGMITRFAEADVRVVVLVGERGREVDEFLSDSLRGDSMKKSVVVVATADQPAVVRMKAAYVGTTIAEYFRDRGRNVILMMDSVTRFARAQREIGLARGEPPARYGFPPSVFAELPRLFERCGNSAGLGSMTGFYTVLVEGDNLDEPVADETRSLLDGHIVLSAKVPFRPRIDLLASESRVRNNLNLETPSKMAASKVVAFLRQYQKDELNIDLGLFAGGVSAAIEKRKEEKRAVDSFMHQLDTAPGEPLQKTLAGIVALAGSLPSSPLQ